MGLLDGGGVGNDRGAATAADVVDDGVDDGWGGAAGRVVEGAKVACLVGLCWVMGAPAAGGGGDCTLVGCTGGALVSGIVPVGAAGAADVGSVSN